MKIQIGKVQLVEGKTSLYMNKTRKYLLPLIKDYGTTFTNKVNNVYKKAVGIGDFVVKNRELVYEKHLFLLLESNISEAFFRQFLIYIREHEAYEDDYVFGNIQNTTLHMVVIKLPEKYNGALSPFKEGQYSEMFDKNTIDTLFEGRKEKEILIKDHNYRITFVTKKLNRIYGTTIKPEEWKGELDLPPKEEEENFNHHLKRK